MADINQKRVRRQAPAARTAAAFQRFRTSLLADRALSLVADEDPYDAAKVLHDGDAALMLSFSDGLLTARYAGPVTAAFLARAQAFGEDAQGCTAVAVVADFTAARVTFTDDDLYSVMLNSRIKQAGRPRALLIPPKHFDMFQEYALRAALKGIFQRLFFVRDDAEAWAREMAAQRDR